MHTRTWLIAPILLAALALGACGGDEDGADGTSTATTAATEPSATGSPAATADGTAAASGGATVDLSGMADQFATAEFTATFNVDGNVDGTSTTGEWTWYQDGKGRLRMDFSSGSGSGTMINTPDQVIVCAQGACFSMAAGASSPVPNLGATLTDQLDTIQAGAMSAQISSAGTRTLAGVQAQCYEFADATANVSGTACYGEDGVPLLMENKTAQGDFRLEATAFKASVSDSDFEAPFPVSALPTGG